MTGDALAAAYACAETPSSVNARAAASEAALRADSPLLNHPPTGAERLSPGRAAVAIVTLAFFVLLFMPTPMSL